MHCLIGFDREICRLVDVLVILVEEEHPAKLQICTVCLISWLPLPPLQIYCILMYCTVLHYSRCIGYSRQRNCRFVLSAWYLGSTCHYCRYIVLYCIVLYCTTADVLVTADRGIADLYCLLDILASSTCHYWKESNWPPEKAIKAISKSARSST